jgi:hypothetical protein
MAKTQKEFEEQLMKANIQFESGPYFGWSGDTTVNFPAGESPDGLFVSVAAYFRNGILESVDIETD